MATWGEELERHDQWLAAGEQSRETRRLRAYWLTRFSRHHGGDPWTVTVDDIAAWLAAGDWSPETRKSVRASLRSFYRWGVVSERIGSNPADRLPTVRVRRGMPRPTPEQTLNRALATATDRDRLMLMLGAFAGLRRAEIARLRFSDAVDGLLVVRGKGGVTRVVPMHVRLVPALACELEERALGLLGSGYRYGDPASPYVFPGQQPGTHITPGAVGKILARMLDMPGHTLRHRFATQAYAGTKDLRAVQELLGHSRPETTAIYTLVPDEALRAAVDAA